MRSDPRIHRESDASEADKPNAEQLGRLVALVDAFGTLNGQIDKLVVDGLVNLAGRAGEVFSRVNGWIDANVVDALVNLVAYVNGEISRGLKLLQTGRVQNYLLVVFFSLLILVGAFVM